ncbi:conserved protein of unknown function(AAA+ ATPase domain,194-344) [Magnetospirillum sp. XM-1]|nr:conserved protein of unknown function(AAA+ ATPase domain,194-344) [Magnetospirillum sp. XM-1]
MARTPTKSPDEIEAVLGPAPIVATTENRTLLKGWLRAKGVPSAVVDKMKLSNLAKCYNAPAYLAAVIRNHHADPSGNSEPYPEPASGPTAPTPSVFEPDEIIPTATPQEPHAMTFPQAPTAAPDTAAALQALLASLAANAGPSEARIIELIQCHAPKPETPVYKVEVTTPTRTITTGTAPRHYLFPNVLALTGAGIHVMLVGPAGSGKTTLAEQVAEALGLPFYFNGAIDTAYKLSGFIDAQGRVVSTAFRKAYEQGGLYLFDEVDASLPGALMAFNAALANGAADFPDGMVKRHPDFRCIAAANTYGNGADRVYVGRNQLDGASLDRFFSVALDYDEDLERMLCPNNDWVRHVQRVRDAVRKLQIRHIVSPRASIMGAAALAAGLDRDTVEAGLLWKGLDKATIAKIQAEV